MKNLVILISGHGSNLQALIDHCLQGTIPATIRAVISDQDTAYGIIRAQQAGIPSLVLGRSANSLSKEQYDQLLAETVAAYQPHLIVLAGFMRLLGSYFLQIFSGKILNIHPSLLPKYPGLNTHQQVLANGDTEHGATVHFVTEKLDAGPIVLQSSIAVSAGESIANLRSRVQQQEWSIYPIAVRWFVEERLLMKQGKAWLDQQPIPEKGYPLTPNCFP